MANQSRRRHRQWQPGVIKPRAGQVPILMWAGDGDLSMARDLNLLLYCGHAHRRYFSNIIID